MYCQVVNVDCQTLSNIILSFLSFVLAAIAIVVSWKTLKQNSKMIESSTRPYIGISGEFINNGTSQYKLILKNYGSSEGKLEALSFSPELSGYLSRKELSPFEHFVGATILPGQCIVCPLERQAIVEKPIDVVKVNIKYSAQNCKKKSSGKVEPYEEEFSVPLSAYIDAPPVRSGSARDTEQQSLNHLSFTLQTIADKML